MSLCSFLSYCLLSISLLIGCLRTFLIFYFSVIFNQLFKKPTFFFFLPIFKHLSYAFYLLGSSLFSNASSIPLVFVNSAGFLAFCFLSSSISFLISPAAFLIFSSSDTSIFLDISLVFHTTFCIISI